MSLKRIRKFRATCDNCEQVMEYESEYKSALPANWVHDEYAGYDGRVHNYYCRQCWIEHCVYMEWRPHMAYDHSSFDWCLARTASTEEEVKSTIDKRREEIAK